MPRRSIIPASLLALAALLLGFVVLVPGAEVPASDEALVGADDARPEHPIDETEQASDAEVTEVSETREALRPPQPPRAVVRGRVLAAESGMPIVGCRVALRPGDPRTAARMKPGAGWKDPGRRSSDASGIFSIEFEPLEGARHSLSIEADGRVGQIIHRLLLEQGLTIDLGDIELRGGTRFFGSVHDIDGRPVPAARVRVFGDSLRYRSGQLREQIGQEVLSGEDGSFEMPTRIPSGSWRFQVADAPPLVSRVRIDVPETPADKRVDLVCGRLDYSDSLRGRVIDARGEPVSGAFVRVLRRSPGRAGLTTTREDGTFRLWRRRQCPKDVPVELYVQSYQRKLEQVIHETFPWGTKDITLSLLEHRGLAIQVLAADGGRPIERYAVQCIPMRGMRSKEFVRHRQQGRHENGITRVANVPPGKNLIVVHPEGSEWLRSDPLLFDVPEDSRRPVQVKLHRPRSYEIVVVGEAGEPVPGMRVDLLKGIGAERPAPEMIVTDIESFFSRGYTTRPFAVRLSHGTTDATGRTRVVWHASTDEFSLRLLGPGLPPQQRDGVRLTDDTGRIRVVVASGATLSGRLLPPAKIPARASLVLSELGGEHRKLPEGRSIGYTVSADGAYAIEGIPAGTWDLWLKTQADAKAGLLPAWVEIDPPLARLSLRPGEAKQLDVDLSGKVESAGISGTVLVNGQPFAGGTLRVACAVRDGDALRKQELGSVRADVQGAFQLAGLRPRHYEIRAMLPCGAGTVPVLCAPFFQLTARDDVQKTIDLRTARVSIRVLDAGGEAAATLPLLISGTDDFAARGTTDSEGRLLLEHLPAGTFEVSISSTRETEAGNRLGKITVPAGRRALDCELRVPLTQGPLDSGRADEMRTRVERQREPVR